MIFVPRKNIWTKSRNWGNPKYQKGILHPIGFWSDTGSTQVDISVTIGTWMGGPTTLGWGYRTGPPLVGVRSPTSVDGHTIDEVIDWNTNAWFTFIIGTDVGSSWLDKLVIGGVTLNESAKTTYSGGRWEWASPSPWSGNWSGGGLATVQVHHF